mmetsp:Transcript_595/g.1629  ORF Transcript_595/g.1629 Transcript_595/m.1629 type:complete len:207 (+) Transcript_595:808-1428(+)
MCLRVARSGRCVLRSIYVLIRRARHKAPRTSRGTVSSRPPTRKSAEDRHHTSPGRTKGPRDPCRPESRLVAARRTNKAKTHNKETYSPPPPPTPSSSLRISSTRAGGQAGSRASRNRKTTRNCSRAPCLSSSNASVPPRARRAARAKAWSFDKPVAARCTARFWTSDAVFNVYSRPSATSRSMAPILRSAVAAATSFGCSWAMDSL